MRKLFLAPALVVAVIATTIQTADAAPRRGEYTTEGHCAIERGGPNDTLDVIVTWHKRSDGKIRLVRAGMKTERGGLPYNWARGGGLRLDVNGVTRARSTVTDFTFGKKWADTETLGTYWNPKIYKNVNVVGTATNGSGKNCPAVASFHR